MAIAGTVDILRRLIVGKRGRGRADRLVCLGADGVARTIALALKSSPSRYVELVESCSPVRIEAYAGKDLVDAWVDDTPAPSAADAAKPKGKGKTPPPKKKTWREQVMDLASHHAGLLSSAYSNHSKELAAAHNKNADKEEAQWKHLVDIAQHHSDRADHALERAREAEKGIRIRDKQILELNGALIKMQARITEIAAGASGEDKKTEAFMRLLDITKVAATSKPAAEAASANGKKEAK
jgi:hypothetical protein